MTVSSWVTDLNFGPIDSVNSGLLMTQLVCWSEASYGPSLVVEPHSTAAGRMERVTLFVYLTVLSIASVVRITFIFQ